MDYLSSPNPVEGTTTETFGSCGPAVGPGRCRDTPDSLRPWDRSQWALLDGNLNDPYTLTTLGLTFKDSLDLFVWVSGDQAKGD